MKGGWIKLHSDQIKEDEMGRALVRERRGMHTGFWSKVGRKGTTKRT
jgi:hypothetical protein